MELATTLRLIADLIEQTNEGGIIRLPGVLEDLRADVLKVFERYEKELETGPIHVDPKDLLIDNRKHGKT